jgi:Glycosyltransferase 61
MPKIIIPYRNELKVLAKNILRRLSSLIGRGLLAPDVSRAFLENSIVYRQDHPDITLPAAESTNLNIPFLSEQCLIQLEPDYVWRVEARKPITSLQVGRYGTPIVNQKLLLNLDFNSTADVLNLAWSRQQVHYPIVVAPWSHPWGSYYDFVIFILTKLCRIEQALTPDLWQTVQVCYPLRGTHYEAQFLDRLGIPKPARIDTLSSGLAIQANCLILANNHPGDLSYCSPQDVALLRRRFLTPQPSHTVKKRLYISRKHRRKVKNEAEICAVLTQEFGFEIVADVDRTVDEQIALFRQAEIVVAPHGAGLTNLIWCDPGTQVIELFYQGYTPRYYNYLCQILGLKYKYMIDEDVASHILPEYTRTIHDMQIKVEDLRQALQAWSCIPALSGKQN